MKRICYLLSVCLSGIFTTAWAQPVATHPHRYAIGDTVTFTTCDTGDYHPGTAGAQQVWDFTAALHPESETGVRVKPPADAPGGSFFAQASYAMHYDDGHANFVKDTGNACYYTGTHNGNTTASYTGMNTAALRPLAFGSSRADTFFTHGLSGATFSGKGYINVVCDGYGTLLLPAHTYHDVLRMRIETVEYDTVVVGSSIPTVSYTTAYVWYDTAHPYELLRMDSVFIHTQAQDYRIKDVYYVKDAQTASIARAQAPDMPVLQCTLYAGRLVLHTPQRMRNSCTVQVRDMSGRLVEQQRIALTGSHTNVTLSNILQAGIYIVTLIDEKGFSLSAKAPVQ